MQATGLLMHPTFHAIDGFDVASILPRHLMQPRATPSVPWGNEGEDCAICITEMAVGDEVSEMPVCHHTFHLECLTKWLETKVAESQTGRCPLCNTQIIAPVFTIQTQPVIDTQQITPQITPHTIHIHTCEFVAVATILLVASSSIITIVVLTILYS